MPTSSVLPPLPTDHQALASKLRRRLGVTQAVFAAMLGVHPQTVSKWERGIMHPTPADVARMTMMDAGLALPSEDPRFDTFAVLMEAEHYLEAATVLAAMSRL